jgi:hypothetical protein
MLFILELGWDGWWGCDAFVDFVFRWDDGSERGYMGERKGWEGRMIGGEGVWGMRCWQI